MRLFAVLALIASIALGVAASASASVFAPAVGNTLTGSSLQTAIGDFNGDGRGDLATASQYRGPDASGPDDGRVEVLLGNANGSFGSATPFDVGGVPFSIATADFNGDLSPDLVVSTQTNGIVVLLGAGDGTFGSPTTYPLSGPARGVAVGDFNGDSDPDLAVTVNDSGDGNSLAILLGGTGGSFGSAVNYAADGNGWLQTPTVADFNGDGDPDIAIPDNGAGVQVLLGSTAGTFASATKYAAAISWSVGAADFNGDGRIDLVGPADGQNVAVLLGDGNGGFGSPTSVATGVTMPQGVAVADFNGDGDPDVGVAGTIGSNAGVAVLLGSTGSAFTLASSSKLHDYTGVYALTAGDLNGDGDPDLVAGDNFATVLFGRKPAKPTGLTTSPASPAANTSPQVLGTTSDGATVKVFTNSACTGAAVATGTSTAFASPGLSVSVSRGSTSTFHAKASDESGVSPCSSDSVTYQDTSSSLQLTAVVHPGPDRPVPFTANGFAHGNSTIFFIATSSDQSCASTYTEQSQSQGSSAIGGTDVSAGSFSYDHQGTVGDKRICAYLYERGACPGSLCNTYDLATTPAAAATVLTVAGPAPDTDGDGVPDRNDSCPNVAGPANSGLSAPGCPVNPISNMPTSCPFASCTGPYGQTAGAPDQSSATDSEPSGPGGSDVTVFKIPAKASLKGFLSGAASLGMLGCVCNANVSVKITPALAKKLHLKSSTIATLKIPLEGTFKLKFSVAKTVRAKLAKLKKLVVSVHVSFYYGKAKSQLPKRFVTLTK